MIKVIKLLVNNGKYINFGKSGMFEFTPERFISILSAENGFGKSTLLRYLTFQPIDRDELNIGGFVEKTIEYNNSIYIITQHNPLGKYSVLKDGTELNLGLTKNGYIACIDREFNISIDLEKVITLNKKFTSMSPSELKEVFSSISTVDYDYAFSMFKKATTNARDIKGVIKHLEDKLTNMETHSTDELANLLESEANYTELIKKKTHEIKPVKHTTDLSSEIDRLINRKERISVNKPYRPASIVESDLLVLRKESDMLSETINDNKTISKEEKDDLEKTKSKLEEEIAGYKRVLDGINITEDYESLFNNNHNIIDDVESISYKVFDIDYDIEETIKSKSLLEQKLQELDRESNNTKSELDFINKFKNDEHIECPNCLTKINLYDENKHKSLTETLIDLDHNSLDNNNKLNSYKEFISKHNEMEKNKTTMLNMIRSMGEVYYTWFVNNNLSITNKISMLTSFVSNLYKYKECGNSYKDVCSKLSGAGDIDKYTKAIDRVNDINKRINELLVELSSSNILEKNAEELKTIDDKINSLKEKQLEHVENESNRKSNIILEQEINELSRELESIKSKITTIRYNMTRKDDVIKELEIAKDRQNGYNILVEKLSPTKGLIAESIDSFIMEIVNRINSYISKIFNYELEVVAPDIDDKGLTYKFGLNVMGQYSKSISKCSTGQKEAINLAFVLTLRDFSNNVGYPLFLDEFGSALSVDNRANTLEFIQNINNGEFQTFMVSHYSEMLVSNAKTKVYTFKSKD